MHITYAFLFSFNKISKIHGEPTIETLPIHPCFCEHREPLFILLFCVITMCWLDRYKLRIAMTSPRQQQ